MFHYLKSIFKFKIIRIIIMNLRKKSKKRLKKAFVEITIFVANDKKFIVDLNFRCETMN